MSYDTIEIANVSGGSKQYQIRAGEVDGDTLSQDTYWADTVTVNGNEITTGTIATIKGGGITVREDDDTIDIEL